jgi:hypothetical protein
MLALCAYSGPVSSSKCSQEVSVYTAVIFFLFKCYRRVAVIFYSVTANCTLSCDTQHPDACHNSEKVKANGRGQETELEYLLECCTMRRHWLAPLHSS